MGTRMKTIAIVILATLTILLFRFLPLQGGGFYT